VAKFYKDANTHTKTFGHRSGWVVDTVLGKSVGFSSGERWRVMRKCLDPFMTNGAAMKQVSRINRAAQDFVARIGNSAINKDTGDDFILIKAAVTVMPFPLLETTRVLWGELDEPEKTTLLDIGQLYLGATTTLAVNGFFRWGLGYWMYSRDEYSVTKEYKHRWETFNRQIYEARRNQPELPIMKLWDHVEKGTLTKDEVRKFCISNSLTSGLTTSSSLSRQLLRQPTRT
jgi:hypothetical protein